MLCFRKENTRPATSSRDRKSAGEKLKTRRKSSFEDAYKNEKINRNPSIVA